MVLIFETASGKMISEMQPQSYADEVLMAGWTELPDHYIDATAGVMPRLAEHVEAPAGKPSPFADPDFIARVYRSQR